MIGFLTFLFPRLKSKAPKENYEILAKIHDLNAEIYNIRRGIYGKLDEISIKEKELEVKKLIKQLK